MAIDGDRPDLGPPPGPPPSWLRRVPLGESRCGDNLRASLRKELIEYKVVAATNRTELLSIEGSSELLASHFVEPERRPGGLDNCYAIWLTNEILLAKEDGAVEMPTFSTNFTSICTIHMSFGPQYWSQSFDVFLRSTTADDAAHSVRVVHGFDFLLQLCAKHKHITLLTLSNVLAARKENPLPASLEGLIIMLAGSSTHLFTLRFVPHALSIDQWRVIALNCPEHIELLVQPREDPGALQAVTESLLSEDSRLARLTIAYALPVLDSAIESLRSALDAGRSLKELNLFLAYDNLGEDVITNFPQIIRRIRGLEKASVTIVRDKMLQEEVWVRLWSAVGSHPTLRSFSFRMSCTNLQRSTSLRSELVDAVICAAHSNQQMCKLECDVDTRTWPASARQQLERVLAVNRFRLEVQTLQSEFDQILRDQLLVNLLVSDSVRDDLDRLYLLLKANSIFF